MRLFLLMSFVLLFSVHQPVFAESIPDSKLKEFGETIMQVREGQNRKAYLALIHPECPSPDSEALDWKFSTKWLSSDKYDIRIESVQDTYDFSKLSFKVMPEAVLGFQVWTLESDGEKVELATVVPIARYKGDLKIIDYPCFDMK